MCSVSPKGGGTLPPLTSDLCTICVHAKFPLPFSFILGETLMYQTLFIAAGAS